MPRERTVKDLKPCPFCGHIPILREDKNYTYVRCSCGAKGAAYLHGVKARAFAIKAWNRRTEEVAEGGVLVMADTISRQAAIDGGSGT